MDKFGPSSLHFRIIFCLQTDFSTKFPSISIFFNAFGAKLHLYPIIQRFIHKLIYLSTSIATIHWLHRDFQSIESHHFLTTHHTFLNSFFLSCQDSIIHYYHHFLCSQPKTLPPTSRRTTSPLSSLIFSYQSHQCLFFFACACFPPIILKEVHLLYSWSCSLMLGVPALLPLSKMLFSYMYVYNFDHDWNNF